LTLLKATLAEWFEALIPALGKWEEDGATR
jgi:hypothetical protein